VDFIDSVHDDTCTVDEAVEVEYDSEENGALIISLGFSIDNIYEKC